MEFFANNPKLALAFSGGVDSSYLLYEAIRHGTLVTAYYVKSQFQPQWEMEHALKVADELGVILEVLQVDVLTHSITANTQQRCYICKKLLLTTIKETAEKRGISVIIDGTNASDLPWQRPGMKALTELSITSPLRDAGLTKQQIRQAAHQAGISVWAKPAYACLATRIPTGMPITANLLNKVDSCECALAEMGFLDFRVRIVASGAKIQLLPQQMPLLLEKRTQIINIFKQHFHTVTLDLEGRCNE